VIVRTRADLLVPGFLAAVVAVVGVVAAVMFVVVEPSPPELSCVHRVYEGSYTPLNGVTMTRSYESALELADADLPDCEAEED
jgi:hypothetical protein